MLFSYEMTFKLLITPFPTKNFPPPLAFKSLSNIFKELGRTSVPKAFSNSVFLASSFSLKIATTSKLKIV